MDLEQVQQNLKANPNDVASLRSLPTAYFNLRRWNEAVEAEKNWLRIIEHESGSDAERTKNLVSAYVGLSWYQLYVRDFAGALASTDAGKKLDDTNLYLETNRAHAFLFLGRTQEAQAIYLGNRGKKLDPKQEQTWDKAILKDFDELEGAGLTNPEISQIRRLLSPEQK